ncbi:hypothetical protein [Actinoplanes sp. N902-109]|uniref:hypothetical protein n=1 Tax=Actinoplanes sp. (strain N902-109) TaxID=649831 RepID=UPI0003296303|nr:hypothetical protein [Actinoplanes sp. N902-109]AGL16955.1 hypothetical protein L083_3445 [Actinoplanes sp. N902-109]
MPATCTLRAPQRTELLHRSLLVRHLGERWVAGTAPVDEVAAVSLLTALGPGDVLVVADAGARRAAAAAAQLFGTDVTVTDAPARVAVPDGERLVHAVCAPVGPHELILVLPGSPVTGSRRTAFVPLLSLDGADVETSTCAATAAVAAARAGTGPTALGLRAPAPGCDPVRVLVNRMRADHQLDEHALRAIDRDARTVALGAGPGCWVPAQLPPAQLPPAELPPARL